MNKEEYENLRPILIGKLEIQGRICTEISGESPYHTSRAIINDEFVLAIDDITYGGENWYEKSISKKLEEVGIVGISFPLFEFCDENHIEFLSYFDEVSRDGLQFKNNDIWEDGNKFKFKTTNDECFENMVRNIEDNFKDTESSDETKAIALYLEASISNVKIMGIEKRIEQQYGIKFKDYLTSIDDEVHYNELKNIIFDKNVMIEKSMKRFVSV